MKSSVATQNRYAIGTTVILALLASTGGYYIWKMYKKAPVAPLSSTVDSSEVIISVGGAPLLTANMFEQKFKDFLMHHEVETYLPLMPEVEFKFLTGLINQLVIDHVVRSQQIDQQEDYRRDLHKIIEVATQVLNGRYFAQKYAEEQTPSDDELKEYYEKNKESYLVSRGGIRTKGVVFSERNAAQEFLKKLGSHVANVDGLAESQKLGSALRDFNLVHEKSVGVDKAVRDAVLALKQFPAATLVEVNDKNFIVVVALEQQEPKYQPLETIKVYIKDEWARKKQLEFLNATLEKFKKEYGFTINQTFLKEKENAVEQRRPKKADGTSEGILPEEVSLT